MVYFRTGLHVCITAIEEISQYSFERLSDLLFLDAEHSERPDWQFSHDDDAHTFRTLQSQCGWRGKFRSVCGDAPISLTTQPQPTTEHTTVDPPRKRTTYAIRRHDRNHDANTTTTAHWQYPRRNKHGHGHRNCQNENRVVKEAILPRSRFLHREQVRWTHRFADNVHDIHRETVQTEPLGLSFPESSFPIRRKPKEQQLIVLMWVVFVKENEVKELERRRRRFGEWSSAFLDAPRFVPVAIWADEAQACLLGTQHKYQFLENEPKTCTELVAVTWST